MEGITVEELTAVYERYKVLPKNKTPDRPSGQCPYVAYTQASAASAPAYKVIDMSSALIIASYDEMVQQKDSMTESMLWTIVRCGLLIKSPLDITSTLIKDLKMDGTCADFETAVPSSTNKVAFTGSMESTVIKVSSSAMETDKTPSPAVETEADLACATSFLCAWLFRFVVKQPGEAYSIQTTKMVETYLRMYGKSSKVLDQFKPSKKWLEDLNNAFTTFSRVRNTIAIYVSCLEEYYKGKDTKIFNVLRYCFFQNLEFMGMHAYTAVVDIANTVSISTPLLLSWLRMDRMELAIDEIAMIMEKHDNGMIDNGATASRLWKYARLINDGYFNRIQTTYNGLLVSVLAWLRIKLGLAKSEGYNSPLNIKVVSGNTYIKDEGEYSAGLVMGALTEVKASQAGSSIIDKMKGLKRKTVQKDEEEIRAKKRKASNDDLGDLSFLDDLK